MKTIHEEEGYAACTQSLTKSRIDNVKTFNNTAPQVTNSSNNLVTADELGSNSKFHKILPGQPTSKKVLSKRPASLQAAIKSEANNR